MTHKTGRPITLTLLLFLCSACTVGDQHDENVQGSAVGSDRATQLALELHDNSLGNVMVVAHRACWANGAPENSLEAIRACIDMGADIIEIDVRLTRDGIPILMHDQTVDRTTNGKGSLTDYDWEAVSHFRLRVGKGGRDAAISDEPIPTLREALELTRGNILVNLDVKADIFEQAFEVVNSVGVGNQILMKMDSPADSPSLDDAAFHGKAMFMPILRQCSKNRVTRNCVDSLPDRIPSYEKYNPIAFEIVYVSEEFFSAGAQVIKSAGSRIWVNTLNPDHAAGIIDADAVRDPDQNWGRLIDLGANIIQTDNPQELLNYLSQKGMHD